ncbi:MAG: hypothetical protein JWN25_3510 [Verrucomicrobiales bacterium]|nr:hypothetical protein [Verrucomicrobiales bacterium]
MKKWNDMDEFEENLKRQTRRTIPGEWRKQILSAAQTRKQNTSDSKPAWRIKIEELFWPNPKAWIGMAFVWILLGLIHLTMVYSNESQIMAAEATPDIMAFGEQEKLFTEAFGQMTRSEASFQTPKKPIAPRSEVPVLFRHA